MAGPTDVLIGQWRALPFRRGGGRDAVKLCQQLTPCNVGGWSWFLQRGATGQPESCVVLADRKCYRQRVPMRSPRWLAKIPQLGKSVLAGAISAASTFLSVAAGQRAEQQLGRPLLNPAIGTIPWPGHIQHRGADFIEPTSNRRDATVDE